MGIEWAWVGGGGGCWTWGQSPASPCARSTWRGLRMYAAAFRPSATADGFRLRCKTDDRFRYPLFVCACFRGMVRFDRRLGGPAAEQAGEVHRVRTRLG